MEDRIRRNEVSARVTIGEESYLFDPHYDSIHTFRWLGHSVLKIVTEEGLIQIHCNEAYGDYLAEQLESEVFERETIGEREYQKYLDYQATTIDESWLE